MPKLESKDRNCLLSLEVKRSYIETSSINGVLYQEYFMEKYSESVH